MRGILGSGSPLVSPSAGIHGSLLVRLESLVDVKGIKRRVPATAIQAPGELGYGLVGAYTVPPSPAQISQTEKKKERRRKNGDCMHRLLQPTGQLGV